MRVIVYELLICEDGEHGGDTYRTHAEALEALITDPHCARWLGDTDTTDEDEVTEALADNGIDWQINSYIIDTDKFNEAPDNKEVWN